MRRCASAAFSLRTVSSCWRSRSTSAAEDISWSGERDAAGVAAASRCLGGGSAGASRASCVSCTDDSTGVGHSIWALSCSSMATTAPNTAAKPNRIHATLADTPQRRAPFESPDLRRCGSAARTRPRIGDEGLTAGRDGPIGGAGGGGRLRARRRFCRRTGCPQRGQCKASGPRTVPHLAQGAGTSGWEVASVCISFH